MTVDDAALLPGLAKAAASAGEELAVLVECDTGFARAGVQSPRDVKALAIAIERTDSLSFEGLLTHPASPGALSFLRSAVGQLHRAGLTATTISIGGGAEMWHAAKYRSVANEYRAGNYVFCDRASTLSGVAEPADVALSVLTTIVSRPTKSRAIIDAGSKSLSSDRVASGGYGTLIGAPTSSVSALDEEHGYVSVGKGDSLSLGQRIRIVPNHACSVVNLFDWFTIVRGDTIIDRWPVSARGRSD